MEGDKNKKIVHGTFCNAVIKNCNFGKNGKCRQHYLII